MKISDGKFVVGCNKFYMSGWNSWEMMEAAAGAPTLFGSAMPAKTTGPQVGRNLGRWAEGLGGMAGMRAPAGDQHDLAFLGLALRNPEAWFDVRP